MSQLILASRLRTWKLDGAVAPSDQGGSEPNNRFMFSEGYMRLLQENR